MKTITQKIFEEIEIFRAKHGMSRYRFSLSVSKDAKFLADIASGKRRSINSRTIDSIYGFMDAFEKDKTSVSKSIGRETGA